MDYPSKRQRVSRIQRRTLALSERLHNENGVPDDQPTPTTAVASRRSPQIREPLLIREKRGGPRILDERHRMLHHRQATQETVTVTQEAEMVVSVLAEVDTSGNTVALSTLASVPSVPSVPAFPSDLTVPAVPQVSSVVLPSVPAYPFASTTSTSASVNPTITDSQSLQTPLPTTFPTLVATNSTTPITTSTSGTEPSIVAIAGVSSQLSSLIPLSGSSLPANSSVTVSTSSTPSAALSTVLSTTHSTLPSTLTSGQSPSRTTFVSSGTVSGSSIASTASDGIGGGGAIFGTSANPDATSNPTASAGSGSGSNDTSGPSTSTVVGGVFGGLAGIALILAIALLILRWYKKKQRGASMERLTEEESVGGPAQRSIAAPPPPPAPAPVAAPAAPPMSDRRSFRAAAGFLNRFSASSKGSDYGSSANSPTTERGFQKISGRKLPSVFSEGITEADVAGHRSTIQSDNSYLRDSHSFFGGSDTGGPTGGVVEKETMMPSPARTPTVHNPFTLSTSPPTPPRPNTQESSIHQNTGPGPGTLGRSHPSHDGSRGSRFTEDVI